MRFMSVSFESLVANMVPQDIKQIYLFGQLDSKYLFL